MFPEVPYYGGRESSTCCNFRKHMQIKETSSSIWQRTCCKCSQHNQKRNALQIKCIWLWAFAACCEHLQHVACCFICLCCEHLQCVSLFVCVVSICGVFLYLFVLGAFAPSAVKLMKMFSWFAGDFSICMCFLKLQHVELSRPPYLMAFCIVFLKRLTFITPLNIVLFIYTTCQMFGVSNIHFLLIHFFHILGCCCMLNCFKLLTLYIHYNG